MGPHWQESRIVVFRSWSCLGLCCVPFTDHTVSPTLTYVSDSCKACLEILSYHFHVKQMVQLGNLRNRWFTLGILDSIWPARVFMTQATYYTKYLLFSTYMSIQFGLMIGITADDGPILYHLRIGGIWLHNKTHFFQEQLGEVPKLHYKHVKQHLIFHEFSWTLFPYYSMVRFQYISLSLERKHILQGSGGNSYIYQMEIPPLAFQSS